MTDVVVVEKKKRGRPRKADVVAKKNKGAVGRPKGETAIINEYRARMLASPRSEKVLDAIYNAALDDEHKNQAAAWKLIMDRMLPLSYFDKDKAGGGRAAVSITITGVDGTNTIIEGGEDIEDATYRE
jgi:hypothetical protein